ncbi:MAG: hypothetical protein ACI8YP_001226 [Algoriphagus sp.]|jgi:hypothetical protein
MDDGFYTLTFTPNSAYNGKEIGGVLVEGGKM